MSQPSSRTGGVNVGTLKSALSRPLRGAVASEIPAAGEVPTVEGLPGAACPVE